MNVAELNAFVRFTLGGLSTSVIDDPTLNQIIQNVLDSGLATTECQEKFYSVKQTLIYLDTKSATGSAETGASGAVKKRVEEVGKRRIEVQWETSGSSGTAASWSSVLEDFLKDPFSYLLCEPFPSTDGENTGSVIICVNTDKYTFSSPYRQNLNPYSKKSSPWS
ncbi:hypothetical protein MYOV085v1_p0095 [Vibrio phage 355E48.1]|nr:hypothetical protein MYOV085v1_p0095 [Vibrio phage 355E48.1]